MKTFWTTDIKAGPEAVWRALTSAGIVQPFYFNSLFEAELRPGGEISYSTVDGKRLIIAGKVLEIELGRKLVHEFRFVDLAEPAQVVTFELAEIATGTRVTIRHQGLEEAPKHASRVSHGWDQILSNLKSWLESGSLPLRARMQNSLMHLFLRAMPERGQAGTHR